MCGGNIVRFARNLRRRFVGDRLERRKVIPGQIPVGRLPSARIKPTGVSVVIGVNGSCPAAHIHATCGRMCAPSTATHTTSQQHIFCVHCSISHFPTLFTFSGKGLPVVIDNLIHDLLVAWIRRRHPNDSGETRLFTGVRWENLLTMLGRIVSQKVLKGAEGSGPIGSKAMRQYAATMILQKSKKPHDAMRRIGMYLCMYLFVLLDLFIPVLRNCHRIHLIYDFPQPNISTNSYVVGSHRKWSDDFHVIPSFQVGARKWQSVITRTASKTPIRSKFSSAWSRLLLNRTQGSQFHFQTSFQADGKENAAGQRQQQQQQQQQ